MAKDTITMPEGFKIMQISRQTYYKWKAKKVKGLPIAKEQKPPRTGPGKMFLRKDVEDFRKSDWYDND